MQINKQKKIEKNSQCQSKPYTTVCAIILTCSLQSTCQSNKHLLITYREKLQKSMLVCSLKKNIYIQIEFQQTPGLRSLETPSVVNRKQGDVTVISDVGSFYWGRKTLKLYNFLTRLSVCLLILTIYCFIENTSTGAVPSVLL